MDILSGAQPPLEFIPPALNPLVLRFSQAFLPLWLKSKTNVAEIEALQVDRLVELYQEFQEKKIRFLLAFRHPSVDDPLCLAKLVWHLLPDQAKQQGISLKKPTHVHCIYDRGIPIWAGSTMGWLYSNLGGTPVMRGKTDLTGLRSARHLYANGAYPMAAAPEGATNGHNEIISPLEPGISQLSFWCVEDLLKANRTEEVLILPMGIQYRYLTPPWQSLEKLITQLEAQCGLPRENTRDSMPQAPTPGQIEQLYQRLYRLGEFFLGVMEDFYVKFYHQTLPKVTAEEEGNPNQVFGQRLHNLLEMALQVAETHFAISPKGNFTDRCRRLEQAGWDSIYRLEFKTLQNLSVVQKGLGDIVAVEANLRMWHMRLVETFVAVTGYYVKEKLTPERFAETTLLLADFITRLSGGNPFARPKLGKLKATITLAEPISVTSRWEDYQTNRRKAVADLTLDLQQALSALIIK